MMAARVYRAAVHYDALLTPGLWFFFFFLRYRYYIPSSPLGVTVAISCHLDHDDRLPSPPPLRPSNAVRHNSIYVYVLATCSYGPPPSPPFCPFRKKRDRSPALASTTILKRLRKARPFFQPVASHLSSRLSVVQGLLCIYVHTYLLYVRTHPATGQRQVEGL